MSNRTRRKSNSKPAAVLIVLGLTVVGLLAYYVRTNPDLPPHVPGKVASGNPRPVQIEQKYHVFDAEKGWAPIQVEVAKGEDPVKAAVVAFTNRAYPSHGVQLLSIDVRNGTANLNFTKGFAEEMGSSEEGMLIEGLMRVLGQFNEIETAEIMVDGEVLETGHNVYDKVAVIRP